MRFSQLFKLFNPKNAQLELKSEFKIAKQTHIGGREQNEDDLLFIPHQKGLLAVVCDGLGGHEGGELASKFFCEGCEAYLSTLANNSSFDDIPTLLRSMIEYSRKSLSKKLTELKNQNKAQTTCVIAWIDEKAVHIAHVGDSRAYIFNQTKQLMRTRDHSVVQMLVDQGEVKDEEMGTHPDQGRLLKTIAGDKIPKPTIKQYPPLNQNQSLILCTDGFWEMIKPEEMMAFNKKNNLDKYLNKLISLANKRAGKKGDNVTAIVVRKVLLNK